jgi:hypothetical protein
VVLCRFPKRLSVSRRLNDLGVENPGPEPLIEPEKLKTQADWIAAGRQVFDEADMIHERLERCSANI